MSGAELRGFAARLGAQGLRELADAVDRYEKTTRAAYLTSRGAVPGDAELALDRSAEAYTCLCNLCVQLARGMRS